MSVFLNVLFKFSCTFLQIHCVLSFKFDLTLLLEMSPWTFSAICKQVFQRSVITLGLLAVQRLPRKRKACLLFVRNRLTLIDFVQIPQSRSVMPNGEKQNKPRANSKPNIPQNVHFYFAKFYIQKYIFTWCRSRQPTEHKTHHILSPK